MVVVPVAEVVGSSRVVVGPQVVFLPLQPRPIVDHLSLVSLEPGEFADPAELACLEVPQVNEAWVRWFCVEEVDAHAFDGFAPPLADVTISIGEDAESEVVFDRAVALAGLPPQVLSFFFDFGVYWGDKYICQP